jgi:hypothetical protein
MRGHQQRLKDLTHLRGRAPTCATSRQLGLSALKADVSRLELAIACRFATCVSDLKRQWLTAHAEYLAAPIGLAVCGRGGTDAIPAPPAIQARHRWPRTRR